MTADLVAPSAPGAAVCAANPALTPIARQMVAMVCKTRRTLFSCFYFIEKDMYPTTLTW
jgi:hypothetical protein